ncbi:MAG: hypothetical protein AAF652_12235 [Cyanobacteria bacterium P01_C01_bin.72]
MALACSETPVGKSNQISFFFSIYYFRTAFIAIAIGIMAIFFSSRAILQPTSLWQFMISLVSFIGGYQLFTRGKLNF